MSKSLEQCLQIICNEKKMSPENQKYYNEDSAKIRNQLMENMKNNCPFFKANFDGLSFTGSYLDYLKIDLPEKFELHMKIKLPFKVTPCANKQRPGFINLLCDRKRNHPAVGTKDKVSRYNLQMWIQSLFLATIGEGLRTDIEDRMYKIEYPKYGRGWGVAHTVIAKEIGKFGFEIYFDFVPVFEFSREEWPFKEEKFKISNDDRSWFAVPHGKVHGGRKEKTNSYVFMVCAPNFKRIVLDDKKNLKSSLRLMKEIRDAQGFKQISNYMLKSLYLEEIDKHPTEFWDQSVGAILIEMLEILSEDLHENRLPFFHHKGVNHLDLAPKRLTNEYYVKVERILRKFKNSKEQSNVNLDEILMIFTKQKQTSPSNSKVIL